MSHKKIEPLRKQIDQLDSRLIALLRRRFHLVHKIGVIKKDHGMPIFQKSRWSNLLKDRIHLAQLPHPELSKLNTLFIRDLFTLIHSESLDLQTRIKRRKTIKEKQNDLS